MSRPFAWSYSALNSFETCPRQYHEMRVKKAWPDPPGEAQQFGQIVHKHLEHRIDRGQALPPFIQHLEPIVQKLETTKGYLQAEYKYALNAEFQPVEFFAKDAWVRAVGDVVKVHEDRAFALDWKTGKYRDGDDQLKLQSNVMFCQYPHVQTIGVVYAWVKERRTPCVPSTAVTCRRSGRSSCLGCAAWSTPSRRRTFRRSRPGCAASTARSRAVNSGVKERTDV